MYISGTGKFVIQNMIIDTVEYTPTSSYMYGAIYIYNANSDVLLDNVSISNVVAPCRGVIYNAGKLVINNSKIFNSTLSKYGTQSNSIFCVANNAVLVVEQSEISNNTCVDALFTNVGANSNTTMNYNNIHDNNGNKTFNAVGKSNFDANYWGGELPSDISINSFIINNGDGTLRLNTSDEKIDKIIKGLNDQKDTPEPQPVVLDIIYVSGEGSDDNEGSQSKPVQTISKAVEIAQKGKIIILPGNYTLTETLSLTKDLTIEGRGNVLIKGDVQLINSSAKLNLTNIGFKSGADVNGSIILSTGTLNIDSSSIYANTASGRAIYVDGGSVNIENSILSNTGYALAKSGAEAVINANNNWWGNNSKANTNADVSTWIIMTAGINSTKINENDEITLTVLFNKTNTGDYKATLPNFNITVSALI